VEILINPERTDKPAVDRLRDTFDELPDHCASLSGYRFAGE